MSAPFTPTVTTVSITAGGTSQVLLAAAGPDTPRQAVLIQPQTEACLINFGATAGVQATGTYDFVANPSNTNTIAFNGTTYTFITGASTGTDVHIESTLALTLAALVVILNASGTAGVALATYAIDSSDSSIVTITYDAGGTDGNAYTLGTSTANIVRSAATLTGGSDTVGNGISLALNQIAVLDASQFPQIREAIYVVSATDAAKIVVTYGSA